MHRLAILQYHDTQSTGIAGVVYLHAAPQAITTVRLDHAGERVGERGLNPLATQIGALA